MKLSEYVRYDGVGLADLVARGQVTAAELAATAQAASDAVNPRLNAIVETWPAQDIPPRAVRRWPACRS